MEKIIIWLKDAANFTHTKGKSGETKGVWMQDITSLFPNRSYKQVYDKFNNYKKAWKEAHNWIKQTGWGLMESDFQEVTTNLQ
ncbi:hypothetical protein RUND412_007848, partial [Rhizina undulata]